MYQSVLMNIQFFVALALLIQSMQIFQKRKKVLAIFYSIMIATTLITLLTAPRYNVSIYQQLFIGTLLIAEIILFVQSRSSFQRLQWRLTLSYVTMTALSVLASITLLTGISAIQDYSSPTTTSVVEKLLSVFPIFAPIIIFASIVGTLFGFLTSRGIIQRLQHLTHAAKAWSQGAFHIMVYDPTHDELGQLAHDFNIMAEQLQQLVTTRQNYAVLEERQRVARDLHDAVKQDVFSIALLIGAARTLLTQQPEKAQEYLREAEYMAEQTRLELTSIIHELKPPSLAAKEFHVVIQEYVQRWSSRTKIAAEVTIMPIRTAQPDLEQSFFRVLQEALTNVAQHSNANFVTILFEQQHNQISLIIEDNGEGFDVIKATGKGLGLSTMRERLTSLNGKLEVQSTPKGTTVHACVPINQTIQQLKQEGKVAYL